MNQITNKPGPLETAANKSPIGKEPEQQVDRVTHFLDSHPGAYAVHQFKDGKNTWLIYQTRTATGYFVTGTALDWQANWKYEDFADQPHLENLFQLSEEEAKGIQAVLGEGVSKLPEVTEKEDEQPD